MVPGHQTSPNPVDEPKPAPVPAAVFPDLNGPQSRGQQCVVCSARTVTIAQDPLPGAVVVGRSGSTGKPVRACKTRCAPMIGYVPPSTAVQETLI
jgi:hypothetical protein